MIPLKPPTLRKLPYGSIPSVTESVFSSDTKEKGTPFKRVSLESLLVVRRNRLTTETTITAEQQPPERQLQRRSRQRAFQCLHRQRKACSQQPERQQP